MDVFWERQEKEPEDAFLAFQNYRDQALPRSWRRVYGYASSKVGEWYSAFKWRERCLAYDKHLDHMILSDREEIVRQTNKEAFIRHARMLDTVMHLCERELAKLDRASLEFEGGGLMKTGELQRYIEMAIKFDRLIRGETTENNGPAVDYSKLSVDELRTLQGLLKKARQD